MSANLPPENPAGLLEQRLFGPLAALRRRSRLYLALEGIVALATVMIILGAAQLLLDRWLRLAWDQRVLINLLITSVWVVVIYRRLLRPLSRPLSNSALALAVDRVNPELQDQISAAVQFARGEVGGEATNSRALMRGVISQAVESAERVDFGRALNHRRARNCAWEAVGLTAIIVLAWLLAPEIMNPWFRRNWLLQDIPWPQRTYLRLDGFDATGSRRAPIGDELEIAAVVEGEVPNSAELRWWTDDGRSGSESMVLVGGRRWTVSLGPLNEDIRFRISAGDERTRDFLVVAAERPQLLSVSAQITPPAYTGAAPLELEQQTVLEMLAGSHLKMSGRISATLERAQLVGPAGPVGQIELADNATFRFSWDEPVAGVYVFEMRDQNGWDSQRPIRFTFKTVADLAPQARLVAEGLGEFITPSAELDLSVAAEDVYGLSEVRLWAQRGDEPPYEAPIAGFSPPQRAYETSARLSLAALPGIAPGQRLRIWLDVADIDPRGPNRARGGPIELKVVSPGDFMAAMAGRELELRQEFERLTSAQRAISEAVARLAPELPSHAAPTASQSQELAGLARRQETHAAQTQRLSEQFRQILGEMRTSKVARTADERRLSESVANPLAQLGAETMPDAAAKLSELRKATDEERIAQAPDTQFSIVRKMNAVLANMRELEGYREAVALLQEIIEEQSAVRQATVSSLERQVEDFLGLESIEREPKGPPP